MSFISKIQATISTTVSTLYGIDIPQESVALSPTRPEFEGDLTYIVFPLVKQLKKSPADIANAIGGALTTGNDDIAAFNVVQGFLNISFSGAFWLNILDDIHEDNSYGLHPKIGKKVLVEFSSPNTNKPLHLGHIRNILLGWSCSRILETAGYDVIKTQIINDRGIAICKSMVAWEQFGESQTPESSKTKGDHFIGSYYVLFESKFKEEYLVWQQGNDALKILKEQIKENESDEAFFKRYKNEYFNSYSPLGKLATDMLIKWEESDPQVKDLWQTMNSWVYQGFNETYDKLGVQFDSLYYESDTYLLGKDFIADGLKNDIFYQKEDNSIWIDLEDVGLDQKLVLRSNGTSVYITQDIGTAEIRYQDHKATQMVYVVADEQDYHFKVLFETMKKLKAPYSEGLHHLSYGMVDLPSGRMKSREGTVVDADDLIAEVIDEVKKQASERGELEDSTAEQRQEIYRRIGLAALKYFILRVNPKKKMIFNPEESVDMQGQTGPYIQNAYVRIMSILRRWEQMEPESIAKDYTILNNNETNLIQLLSQYPQEIQQAAAQYDPSNIAAYAYSLAREFHRFYHDVRILSAESPEAKALRIKLCQNVAKVLKSALDLLGVEMPDRM